MKKTINFINLALIGHELFKDVMLEKNIKKVIVIKNRLINIVI